MRDDRAAKTSVLSAMRGKRLDTSEAGRFFLACTITIVSMTALYLLVPITYQVGDDAYYRAVTSGYVTGSPDGHTVFTGYALASIIALAESVRPSVPWYDLISVGIIFISSVSIIKTLIKRAYRYGVPLRNSLIVCILFFSAYLAYPIAIMNFSTTALVSGAAACAVMIEFGERVDGVRQAVVPDAILMVLLLVLCHEWRPLMFEVSSCFFLLSSAYRAVVSRGSLTRSILVVGCIATALIAACTISNLAAYASSEWQEYIQFNKARAHFMDYSHDSYAQNPSRYEQYGWNEELLKLVEDKFLMSEKVTRTAFESLSNGSNDLPGTLRYLVRFFRLRPIAQGTCFGLAVMILYLMLNGLRKDELPDTLYAFVFCLLALAVIIYCCHQGNLYYRHFVGLVLFPAVALLCCVTKGLGHIGTSLRGRHFSKHAGFSESRTLKPAQFVIALSLILPLVMNQQVIMDSTRTAIIESRKQTYHILLDYAEANKDKVLIGSIYPSFSLFDEHAVDKEENYFFWGHFQSMMYSPLFYEKLSNAGITASFDESIFFQPNVFYVGTEQVLADELLTYINEVYDGNYTWVSVATLPTTYVASANGSRYIEETYDAALYGHAADISECSIEVLRLQSQ